MLNDKSILITGGTGSFGKHFIQKVTKIYKPTKLIVYSRDELKQYEMHQNISNSKYSCLRYFLGDVRDQPRLRTALEGVDLVIHAAALKQVPAAEYNPFEAVKTNIIGAQNLIEAAISCDVKKVIALSTDKAASPINLYGATKLASDKLFIAANNFVGSRDIKFSVVRYGNVMGSRGSVIPLFMDQSKKGILSITDIRMTRFNITLDDGVNFVIKSIENMKGGEIFVPKIPSYRILDLAEAIAPGAKKKIIGIRPGEKLHEEMITVNDARNTIEFENYFIITPNSKYLSINFESFLDDSNGARGSICIEDFSYNSGTNVKFLNIDELRKLINKNILS